MLIPSIKIPLESSPFSVFLDLSKPVTIGFKRYMKYIEIYGKSLLNQGHDTFTDLRIYELSESAANKLINLLF